MAHDCDLAVLTVTDPAFWCNPNGILPLEMGEVPQLQESVLVCGYPTGGDNTSVTSGVVSRVEVRGGGVVSMGSGEGGGFTGGFGVGEGWWRGGGMW